MMDSDRSGESGREPAIERAAFPFEIQEAAPDDGGRFRVTGIMNSFKVMYSGRILHPRGFEGWLKRSPGATLPMLANHGLDVGGFATIGVWDRFERVKGGMLWSGYLAADVPLADQARKLLEQKVLRHLSVGWAAQEARRVRLNDKGIDPLIRAAMEEAGATEVLAFLDWFPVEGSLADVVDDPGARIAARAGMATVEAALAPLRQEVATLREVVERLTDRGGAGEAAALLVALRQESAEFIDDLKDTVIEALQTDPALRSAGEALRETLAEIVEEGSDRDALGKLHERVANFGKAKSR